MSRRYGTQLTIIITGLLLVLALSGCGDDEAEGGADTAQEVVLADVAADTVAETTPPADTVTGIAPPSDTIPESVADVVPPLDTLPELETTPAEVTGDTTEETGDTAYETFEGLPTFLPFELSRPESGEPLTDEEVTAFTAKVTGLYAKVNYFDWVLYYTHGVDTSTGLKDYKLWWSGVHAEKEGDKVTFVHSETGEGHNIMTKTSKILGSAISGHLMTGDPTMTTIAEQLCKGVTATMLGMVHDEDDPLLHLMSRNVVTFDHDYLTHDGKETGVVYSTWFSEYQNWNAGRFEYVDNPYWGPVWVTNMRSKDDVSRLYRIAGVIQYAAELSPDQGVQEACSEAYGYLTLFAQDIVDSGYYIRTKDADGVPFIPGQTGDTEADAAAGDLASYVDWEPVIPGAECNAKAAAAFLGYGSGLDNDCGDGGPNDYESLAMSIHYFNIWIIRSHHLSHLMQALVNQDFARAELLLQGLIVRYEGDMVKPDEFINGPRDQWERDLAQSLAQASTVGYPLTYDEARLVQKYYLRAVEEYATWPNWDLWDPSLGDGTYQAAPPNSKTLDDGTKVHWIRHEDLGILLDYCWSPFKNPTGVQWVDCDLLLDVAGWDPAAVDAD